MSRRLAALVWGVACCGMPATVWAGPGENSFTPTGLYVPIHFVRLENGSTMTGAELYRCPSEAAFGGAGPGGGGGPPAPDLDPGAEDAGDDSDGGWGDDDGAVAWLDAPVDDCLIDMADNAALQQLFAEPVEISPGTYDRIRIYTCGFDGAVGYTSYVRGEVELSGDRYFTAGEPDEPLTRHRADSGFVAVPYGGCAADVPLPAPVVLEAGEEVQISAFFSLRNIAWATLTGQGPPGGCTFSGDGLRNVCTGYPIPIAYLGAASPALDTYHITEDLNDLEAAKAGGQLLLLRSTQGEPFGGFSRRLYSPTSVSPSVNYDTPIKRIQKNGGAATYLIETWGGGSPGGPPIDHYLRFPAFELQTHQQTLTGPLLVAPIDYRAVRQSP